MVIHPNSIILGPFPRTDETHQALEDRLEDLGFLLNSIIGPSNFCPYIARVVDRKITWISDTMVEISPIVEPVSVEQMHEHGHYSLSLEKTVEDREANAQLVTRDLWQKSWYDGIPADATIFCAAHQSQKPAHGSNHYEQFLLCNTCVGYVERQFATQVLFDIEAWVVERGRVELLSQAIDQIEEKGAGYIQLDQGRWLDLKTLYEFVRHSPYKDDHVKSHWPYADMTPAMYQGYVRINWKPGEYMNTPVQQIVFSSRNRLMEYIEAGGHLKGIPEPDLRELDGDEFPL